METTDFLEQVDDNFLCSICHNVMVSPRACSQGHQFCHDCISTWLQRSQTCPSRCGDLAADSLMTLRIAENMINKLQVRCCHAGVADGPSLADSDAGCGWTGALEERAMHLRDDCSFLEVECGCEGCDAKVLRSQLVAHEASCEHREVFCEKCGERAKAGEMSDHLLGCRMLEIECPQECGARVLRGDVGEHEKVCANVVVSCSFAEHGCEMRGKRKKIGEHEEEAEAVVAHARLAARRAGRELERNAALEKEVSELKQALAEKSNEVRGVLAEALAEKSSQVTKLEQQLEESKRQLAFALKAAGQAAGEAKVTWKIEGFTAKALAKQKLTSEVFHVQTKDGVYHLKLYLTFSRQHGSMIRGAINLYVQSLSGCEKTLRTSSNYPVGLGGTVLTIQKGAKMKVRTFTETSQLQRDKTKGYHSLLGTDKIPGLNWTEADNEARAIDKEPKDDVTDFLENDTLTVCGEIRVTPPEDIAI